MPDQRPTAIPAGLEHRSSTEIHRAARKIACDVLARGLSTGYIAAILDQDPAWKGADMADIERVRLQVGVLYRDAITRIGGLNA